MVKNPYQTLLSMGVPQSVVADFLAPAGATAAAAASSSGGVSVSAHWWGFQLTLSSQLTSDLVNGTEAAAALSAAIAAVQPELAPVAGVIAAALCGMGAVIGLANQGNGVHFDLNWAELAIPLALPAALIPLPNKKS